MTRGNTPLKWTKENEQAFKIKRGLGTAPVLTLPDISKPFHQYVHERKGIAKGVLTQALGPEERLIAYSLFEKRLDPEHLEGPLV